MSSLISTETTEPMLSVDPTLPSESSNDSTIATPTVSSKRARSKSPIRSPRGRSPGRRHPHPPNMDTLTVFEGSKLTKKQIPVGNSAFEYGVTMGEMTDSTSLYRSGDRAGLRQRLATDGYIFIRGAIDYQRALRGRKHFLEHLAKKGAFVPGTDIDQALIADRKDPGWTVDAETGGFVSDREPDSAIPGWRALGWSEELRAVYAGDDLKALYSFLWGQERTVTEDGFNMLSDVTWLRAKGKNEVTAEHGDYYYFKQNTDVFQTNKHPAIHAISKEYNAAHPASFPAKDSIICDLCEHVFQRSKQVPSAAKHDKEAMGEWHCADCARQAFPIYTCWISLGTYTSQHSSLCVLPRSHVLTEFHNPLRGGLLPGDYNNVVKSKWGWQRGEIGLGDIILFNVKTVHGASKNTTNSYRLSMDTRVSAHWFRPRVVFGEDTGVGYQAEDGTVSKTPLVDILRRDLPVPAVVPLPLPSPAAGDAVEGEQEEQLPSAPATPVFSASASSAPIPALGSAPRRPALTGDAPSLVAISALQDTCPSELVLALVPHQSIDNAQRVTGAQPLPYRERPVSTNPLCPAIVAATDVHEQARKPRQIGGRVLYGDSEGGEAGGAPVLDSDDEEDEELVLEVKRQRKGMM